MALYTSLTKKQISDLVSHFGLSAPKKIKGILEGTVNTYYKLDYADGSSYFLKIDETADKKRLKKELQVFALLNRIQKKLPFDIPLPLPTRSGKYSIPLKRGALKEVLLFKTIAGKTATPSSLTSQKLKQIGKALAYLHRLTQKNRLNPHRFNLHGQTQVFQQIRPKLKKKLPVVEDSIAGWLSFLKRSEPKKIPSGLIHADLFPENILFVGNRLKGILDFEAAGKGAFLFDIAVSLHALTYTGKKFDPKKITAFLTGYLSVRRFTREEIQSLEYYLLQSALRFLLTRLRDFELKDGPVKAKPFKDYREYVKRFGEVRKLMITYFKKARISPTT